MTDQHKLKSAVLVVKPVPEVDGERMLTEWHGGDHLIYRYVDREVYELTCACGEQGVAFFHKDIAPVFDGHLEREREKKT